MKYNILSQKYSNQYFNKKKYTRFLSNMIGYFNVVHALCSYNINK